MKYQSSCFEYILQGMLFHRFIGIIIYCSENKTQFIHSYTVQCATWLIPIILLTSFQWLILRIKITKFSKPPLNSSGVLTIGMDERQYRASKVEPSSTGGHFKNTYELLNLRALKISKLHKNHIFHCMGKIFCMEFQRVPLKFHTKYLTHTLKDVDFIHIWKFKSSLI